MLPTPDKTAWITDTKELESDLCEQLASFCIYQLQTDPLYWLSTGSKNCFIHPGPIRVTTAFYALV